MIGKTKRHGDMIVALDHRRALDCDREVWRTRTADMLAPEKEQEKEKK
jgi:hypothetical protein